jgi:hypothetical protein
MHKSYILKRVKNVTWRFKVLMSLLFDVSCENKSVHTRGNVNSSCALIMG